MGLYDNYQLANSSQIKQYQGSVVPELVQVSQQLQNRYDAVQSEQDYLGRFMNSLQALPQDQPALKQFAQGYRDKLKQLASRPDKENLTRETTMLAQDLPDAYAPFAQAVKDRQAAVDEIMKNDKLTPESKELLVRRNDLGYKGLQVNPETGRYQGSYTSKPYVDDLNINEWVDKQLDKVFPTTQGYSREQIGDQWIIKQGGKTVRLEPGRIQQILHDAAGADTHFQAWMQQQQELGTLGTDYSKLDPAHLNMDQQVGSRMVGRKEVPTTLRDVIQPLLDKGMSFSDAMKLYQQSSIAGNIMDRAYAYGNKYIRNDVESEQGVSVNPYGHSLFEHNLRQQEQKEQQGQVLQLASTMTLGGADVKSAADFGTMRKQTEDVHNQSMQQYHDWLKDKRTTPDGKIWKQEDGKWVDVTADANQFRSQIQYAQQQKQQMDAIDKAAQNASGYKVTSELKKKAQEAYDKVMNDKSGDIILPGSSMGTSSTAFNNKTKQEKAQMAYDNVIKNPNDPTYQRYQDELKRRMTGTTVGTDLFAFTNEKVVDALSGQLENMISGLGNDKGMVPVQIGSGANKGQQLSADDWNELKGKIKVIGTTISGDPSSPVTLVARAFKNVKGKKTEGEDMVIRLPNTNIASIAQQNMSPIQYYYMQKAAGIASSLNNFAQSATLPIYDDQGNQTGAAKVSKNNNDPRGGYTVTIGNEQRTVQSFKDIIDFMDQHK